MNLKSQAIKDLRGKTLADLSYFADVLETMIEAGHSQQPIPSLWKSWWVPAKQRLIDAKWMLAKTKNIIVIRQHFLAA